MSAENVGMKSDAALTFLRLFRAANDLLQDFEYATKLKSPPESNDECDTENAYFFHHLFWNEWMQCLHTVSKQILLSMMSIIYKVFSTIVWI